MILNHWYSLISTINWVCEVWRCFLLIQSKLISFYLSVHSTWFLSPHIKCYCPCHVMCHVMLCHVMSSHISQYITSHHIALWISLFLIDDHAVLTELHLWCDPTPEHYEHWSDVQKISSGKHLLHHFSPMAKLCIQSSPLQTHFHLDSRGFLCTYLNKNRVHVHATFIFIVYQ